MRSAHEWARMLQPDSIGRMADPAWVIAAAQAEARREALEEAIAASDGERCDQRSRDDDDDHCCGYCCGCRRESSDAIRALAAKVQP